MASARFAWGIDVGNRALKAVKLVREGDALRVDDFEVIEHENVLSNAGDNKDSLIQSALANFVQKHQIKGGAVGIGVSGQSSFARFIKLPPVEERKIPEIVRFEAIQQIPFPLEDVEWSYQLFQDPASPDVEVGIFAMRKELVNRNIQFFTDVDMNVQVVQMNPLAVYNAMFYDKRIDGTTMIVDLGAENTDLIIAEGETIWMRSIPIGGNNFTEALVKQFKLNFQKAEDLKRTAATSKYARQIFQAMRPIFADLVSEIQRSIGFYASVHRDSRIRKIVALGGTFRLPGLQKYLQQNLQLEVERIDSLGAGAPADPKQAAMLSENILSSLSAYGLAIQAMGEAKITSSLLPMAIQRERMWREKTKWFAMAAAAFVVGTGLAYGSWYMQSASYAAAAPTRQQIASIQQQATMLDTQWSQIEQSGSQDRQRISNVKSMEQYRYLWNNIMIDIYRALPTPQWPAGDIDKMKAIPRGDRNEIIIDSITSTYVPDLTANLTAAAAVPADMGGPSMDMQRRMDMQPQMPSPDASTEGPKRRGFVVTIVGSTPNRKGFGLVDAEFVRKLRTVGPSARDPRKNYKIVDARIAEAVQFHRSPTRMAALQAAYGNYLKMRNETQENRGGGGGGVRRPPPNPFGDGNSPFRMPAGNAAGRGGEENIEAFLDRFTGEDVRQDWEFEVRLIIELDPPPYEPPQTNTETASNE
jgi:type IV pilus assembly protein PilM